MHKNTALWSMEIRKPAATTTTATYTNRPVHSTLDTQTKTINNKSKQKQHRLRLKERTLKEPIV